MYSTPVVINNDPIHSLSTTISTCNPTKIFILTDKNTKKYCYPVLKHSLPAHTLITVEAGEPHKNLSTCIKIWTHLTKNQADRAALLINLGGGMVCDMGGFAAAVYKRGISFIHVPTTLLSMVDAAVGGKLGIDFLDYKNQLGIFQFPHAVIINVEFLNTLPLAELISGFAEVVKHSLLDSPTLWHELRKKEIQDQDWLKLIKHSVEFKQRITEADPYDKGLRKILNLGHTIGHALESYFLSEARPIRHGEAVAAGILVESFISNMLGMLPEGEFLAIEEFIFTNFPMLELEKKAVKRIMNWLKHDKKNYDSNVKMSLLESVGSPKYDVIVDEKTITKALHYYITGR